MNILKQGYSPAPGKPLNLDNPPQGGSGVPSLNNASKNVRMSEKRYIEKGGKILGRVRLSPDAIECIKSIKQQNKIKTTAAAIRFAILKCGKSS